MAISPASRVWAALLLSTCFISGRDPAHAQAAVDKASTSLASKTDKSAPALPHRQPRVISNLAEFHLERQPGTNTQPQTGAGSRGSAATALTLCAPTVGVSASTRPLFQWIIPDGNPSHVTFTLLNSAGDVVYENDVTGTSLEYPAEAPALLPGQSYSWKVSGGRMNSLPEPIAIEVESKSQRESVQQQAATGDASTDPLVHAQIYLQNHLWYDTVASLEKSIAEFPGRSDLRQQLAFLYNDVVPACVGK